MKRRNEESSSSERNTKWKVAVTTHVVWEFFFVCCFLFSRLSSWYQPCHVSEHWCAWTLTFPHGWCISHMWQTTYINFKHFDFDWYWFTESNESPTPSRVDNDAYFFLSLLLIINFSRFTYIHTRHMFLSGRELVFLLYFSSSLAHAFCSKLMTLLQSHYAQFFAAVITMMMIEPALWKRQQSEIKVWTHITQRMLKCDMQ